VGGRGGKAAPRRIKRHAIVSRALWSHACAAHARVATGRRRRSSAAWWWTGGGGAHQLSRPDLGQIQGVFGLTFDFDFCSLKAKPKV
jgi:hypothetical protein